MIWPPRTTEIEALGAPVASNAACAALSIASRSVCVSGCAAAGVESRSRRRVARTPDIPPEDTPSPDIQWTSALFLPLKKPRIRMQTFPARIASNRHRPVRGPGIRSVKSLELGVGMRTVVLLAIILSPFIVPGATSAQNQTGRLTVTVNDTTGGSLPTATVTVSGLDPANKARKIAPLQTETTGIVNFDGLAPGRYAVVAEFTGFETSPPREVRVRAGQNRLTIVLALARLKDEVVVGRDQQVAGSDRASTFGSMLTREQIDQLSDDPAIARQQLEDLAEPLATIRVDSFEGGQLPNEPQIRSIRTSRDQSAAESHSAGGIRIEIVTQPGQGAIRGQVRTNFYTSKMDGSNPLVDRAPPSRNLNGGMNLSGGLLKDRMSFNLNWSGTNNYTSPGQIASGSSNTATRVLPIKTRNTSESYSGGIDWAVTTNQTARISVSRYKFATQNAGLGAYDAPERGYATENPEWYVQGGHTGPIGRRMMFYNRFYYDAYSSISSSVLEAPTYIVPDD